MNLALFDFDGTITKDDSFLEFIKFVFGNNKFLFGFLYLSPILLLYKLRIIQNYKAKESVLKFFFKGISENEFRKITKKYSLEYIDNFIRIEALKRIYWHKNRGDKVVVVSASIECWLKPWCEKNGIELLATQLEVKDNIITGKLKTKNCYGIEKVNRINSKYNLKKYNCIYAYGDSKGDKEMLKLANKRYFKPFR